MWEPDIIESMLLPDIQAWQDHALTYPLKAMHEALDPAFRKTLILPNEPHVISSVLVIFNAAGFPVWSLFLGLYKKKPGFDAKKIAMKPAMLLQHWPGELRDNISRAGASLIMRIGGEGIAQIDRLKYGLRVRRPVSGVEAHKAIERGKNRYPLLSRA